MLLYYFKPNPQGSTLTTQVMRCTIRLERNLLNFVAFFLYSIYRSHCTIGTIHRSHCTIQLAFNFFFPTFSTKNFQFQQNKLFSNILVVLASFQNHLSRNNVEIHHQYHNHLGIKNKIIYHNHLEFE